MGSHWWAAPSVEGGHFRWRCEGGERRAAPLRSAAGNWGGGGRAEVMGGGRGSGRCGVSMATGGLGGAMRGGERGLGGGDLGSEGIWGLGGGSGAWGMGGRLG